MKSFDAECGFGFIGGDDGAGMFLHTSILPEGAVASKPGARVEYGIADGCKGPQTLTVKISPPARSVSAARRRKLQVMVPVVEDLTKLLDVSSTALRNGKYPENSRVIARVLRVVVDDLDT